MQNRAAAASVRHLGWAALGTGPGTLDSRNDASCQQSKSQVKHLGKRRQTWAFVDALWALAAAKNKATQSIWSLFRTQVWRRLCSTLLTTTFNASNRMKIPATEHPLPRP